MRFVECTVLAEKFGFDTVWFGDHLVPWTHSQNKSAFCWSVMSVALDRTKTIRVGPVVTTPIGGRYHPIIIGQAAATLNNMYPGRFLLGVGSGEAINEAMFFPQEKWPKWQERTERLCEGITLMKKMWQSPDYFAFEGKYFPLSKFFLYTKPKTEIPIYFSAVGEKAATYAGIYGDHLVTINSPSRCRDVIFPIFEAAARKTGKDPSKMEKMVEMGMSRVRPSQSRSKSVFSDIINETDPREIEEMRQRVSDSTHTRLDPSPDDIIEAVDSYWKVGATHVEIDTNSFPERIRFLGEKVLPYFLERRDDYSR